MDNILLTEVIAQAKVAIAPIGHSQSTVYQYGLAWNELHQYFKANNQIYFSEELAHQFVKQARVQFKEGLVKEWRFKLYRLAVAILIVKVQNRCLHDCALFGLKCEPPK